MKFKIIAFSLFSIWFIISCTNDAKYSPSDCLPIDKQEKILEQIVRYANKLAPEATHNTKFSSEFDWYYGKAISESKILYCAKKENDTYHLLVARKARSITPMEEGIAIKVKLNGKDSLLYYQEVFRMWKMPSDTLLVRGKFLFRKMINNEDLTLYYSIFQKDRFIEFPDQRFTFDTEKRRWRDKELDTLSFN
jgi:hypothetical protein